MKHFFVTRFNLRYEGWKTAKDDSPVLSDQWLNDRFELFQKYCFPSVANQKNQDFLWAVYFDIDTPSIHRKMVEKMAHEYSNFRPFYIDGMGALLPSFKELVMGNIDSEDDFVITSRLDNDDAIHCDFVDTIQKLAVPKNETVIDLQQGYQLNVTNNLHDCRENYYYPSNPFISLVEATSKLETVLSRGHPEWAEAESIIVFKDRPLWIEVVHEKNKANGTRPDLPITGKVKLEEFGISRNLEQRSFINILSKNMHGKHRRLYMPYLRRAKGMLLRTYNKVRGRAQKQPQDQPQEQVQERQQKHDIAGMNRVDIISALAKRIDAQDYLEIGTAYGRVFNAISCKNKVSVDPCTTDRSDEYKPTYQMTSDEFFAQNDHIFDLVFIDGLHEAGQIERDINNALKFLKPGGFIVCHDMSPHTESMQAVPRIQPEWTGDGWKAWVKIRSTNPNLEMFVVDTDYGCGVITQGSQTVLDLKGLEVSYKNFDKNREEWLNLISPEDFENY